MEFFVAIRERSFTEEISREFLLSGVSPSVHNRELKTFLQGGHMSGLKTSRRILASTAAIALAVGVTVAAGSSANAATKPVTGGTLYFITHQEQFDHVDPARVYTGRDIAFFNSYLYRNLVSYKPVPGSAGSSLVADLATNTGVPSNAAKTWKFTLRSGITWEDGSKITCEDVKIGRAHV